LQSTQNTFLSFFFNAACFVHATKNFSLNSASNHAGFCSGNDNFVKVDNTCRFIPPNFIRTILYNKIRLGWFWWGELSNLIIDFAMRIYYAKVHHQLPNFWKMIFWLVLKLEISYYRVIISWSILVSFKSIFWRLYFCMVKLFESFHNVKTVLFLTTQIDQMVTLRSRDYKSLNFVKLLGNFSLNNHCHALSGFLIP
jgi:hypothetical protein